MSNQDQIRKMKKDVLQSLIGRQKEWSASASVDMERPEYTATLAGNLFRPLSSNSLSALGRGQGGELGRRNAGATPPKFHALHSSSALAANVFDYWQGKNLSVLTTALLSPNQLESIEVEVPFATGYGFPCNLDVVLEASSNDWVLAIESKFTEPYRGSKPELKLGYVPIGSDSAWKKLGLDNCDRIARDLQVNPKRFQFLDAPQLLKHILGLHRKTLGSFRLLYLYYGVNGEAGNTHSAEVDEFKGSVGNEIDFDSITYQDLVRLIRESLDNASHRDYLDYLKHRYGLPE
jgi:hypothetical protein